MKHLGDITKIKGCNAPVVDCIIGGSPCQDLSVAGKRAGLAGERSGLYMEQIRIIKEMRYKDEQCGRTGESIRPRYMVWENVPGAFSSNKGKDFAAVLEEAIKVSNPEAPDVPVPEKGWPTSGYIMGDSWSVAWRVLDAQFWGVPQRRRRIALVADFGGQSAPEILFIRKGVSGDIDESEQTRKATSRNAENRSGADDRVGAVGFPLGFRPENVRCYDEVATTLCNGTRPGFTTGVIQPVAIDNHPADSRVDIDDSGKVQTLTSRMCTGGGNVPMVLEPLLLESNQNHATIQTDGICTTLPASMGMGGGYVPMVCEPVGFDAYNQAVIGDKSKTLNSAASDADHVPCVMEPVTLEPVIASREGGHIYEGVSGTLRANAGDNQMAVAHQVIAVDQGGGKSGANFHHNLSPTLTCTHGGEPVVAFQTYQKVTGPLMANSHPGSYTGQDAYSDMLIAGPVSEEPIVIDRAFFNQGRNAQYEPQVYTDGTVPTLIAKGPSAVQVRYIVRRLTPLECERLQGYPDGWTDIGEWVDSKGKKHKEADSPRYKALGNSIAIPPWKWVLKRLCACYERDATMASLFDGIGGFPYIWEQLNGKGSCLWASEIEEFPMAVTKIRFGG
jgi:DNA (cytosine-5)-methyltransferase 1